MKAIKPFLSTLFILFFLSFASCTLLQRTADKAKALSQCKFELKRVEKKVSFTQNVGNIWNYVITYHIAGINPSAENISLGGYKLNLYANNKLVSNLATQSAILLLPRKTTMIDVKAIFSPSGVWTIFWKSLMNKKIEYRIKGTFFLKLGTFNYPFEVNLAKWEDNVN